VKLVCLASGRRHLSYDDDCLEDKRENYQSCSLCCIVCDSDVDTFLSSSYIVTVGLALDVLLVDFLSVLINAVCSCVLYFHCIRFSFFSLH